MTRLIVSGVDIAHSRLIELTKLADQSKPFYDWVELRFQTHLSRQTTLDELLRTTPKAGLKSAITNCYLAENETGLPFLFDGVGRSYPHKKACFYFFSWLVRDAPQQRLVPLIRKMMKNTNISRFEAEIETLSVLIDRYRANVKTFSWQAVREIIIDRLEGSRRSIKGHEKEVVVRTALLIAFQTFFEVNHHFGRYAKVQLADKAVLIGNETFDVTINLLDAQDKCVKRVLLSIKTRETEGGGHSHLFTRDIKSAISAVKFDYPGDFLMVVIVAQSWSERDTKIIRELVDYVAVFDTNSNEFHEFGAEEQDKLNAFVAALLKGHVAAKSMALEK